MASLLSWGKKEVKKVATRATQVAAQINPLDNGRTYQQRTPVNNRSVIGQLTHNAGTNTAGNFVAKPFIINPAENVIETGRGAAADITNNQAALKASASREATNIKQSIPGMTFNLGYNAGTTLANLPGAVAGDIRGFSGKAPTAYEQQAISGGATAFEKTPVAQLVSPAQKLLGNNKAVAEGERAAGYDPNAPLSQTLLANPLEGAVTIAGTKAGAERTLPEAVKVATALKGATKTGAETLKTAVKTTATKVAENNKKLINDEGGFIASKKAAGFNDAEAKGQTVQHPLEDKPTFEVSDKGAKPLPLLKSRTNTNTTLDKVLDHPKLYEQYPHLKDLPVVLRNLGSSTIRGGYSAEGKTLYINKNISAAQKGLTIIHEVQHAIQNHEELQTGGAEKAVAHIARDRVNNDPDKIFNHTRQAMLATNHYLALTKLREATDKPLFVTADGNVNAALADDPKLAPLVKEVESTHAALREENAKPSRDLIGHSTYKDIFGENVARTTAARRDMTDAERKAKPFYKNMDTNPVNAVTMKEDGPYGTRQYNAITGDQVDAINKFNGEKKASTTGKPVQKAPELPKPASSTKLSPKVPIKTSVTPAKIEPGKPEAPSARTSPVTSSKPASSSPLPTEKPPTEKSPTSSPATKLPQIKAVVNTGTQKTKVASLPKNNTIKLISKPLTGQKRSGGVATVRASKEVTDATKAKVNAIYDVSNNKAVTDISNKKIATGGLSRLHDQVMAKLNNTEAISSAQDTSDAIAVAKAHDAAGNDSVASDIYNKLVTKLTKQGAGNQALAILNRRSPEGIRNSALKAIIAGNKGLKNVTDIDKPLRAKVQAAYTAIRASKEGTQARYEAIQSMQKLVSQNTHHSLGAKAFALWRTGLLTGPQTMSKVVASHLLMNVAEKVKDIPATAIDTGISGVSRLMGKGPMRSTALTIEGTRDAIRGGKAAYHLLRTGKETQNTGGFTVGEHTTDLTRPDVSFKNGFTDKLTHGVTGSLADFYVQKVGQIHAAIPKAFFTAAQANDLVKQGIADGINKGLKGREQDEYVQRFVQSATAEAKQEANAAAQKATFQQDTVLTRTASKLQQVPGGRFVAPFAKVATNILDDVASYTPVGTVKAVVNAIRDTKNGGWNTTVQKHFVEELGRSITGTGAAVIGAELYKAGNLTLGYPTDKKEQALWVQEGRTADSIKINGKWRSTASLGPPGTLLALGGYLEQSKSSDAKGDSQLATAGAGVLDNITSQSYLSGVEGLASALNDPTGEGNTYAKQVAGSVVPIAVATGAKAADKNQRIVNNPIQAFESKVPGLRGKLQTKTAPFGATEQRQGGVLTNVVDPTRPSADTSTPLTNELDRLYKQTGKTAVPLKPASTKDLKLTGKEQQQIQQTVGPQAQTAMTGILNDSRYSKLGDDNKVDAMTDALKDLNAVEDYKIHQQQGTPVNKLTGNQQTLLSGGKVDWIGNLKVNDSTSSGGTSSASSSSGTTTSSSAPKTIKTQQTAYQKALTKYQSGVKDGSISPIQQSIQAPKLAKQAITSNYDPDIVALYNKSASAIADYLDANPDPATQAQLQDLDAKLVNTGIVAKSKFTTGSASTKKAAKAKAYKIPKISTANNTAINKLLTGSTVKARTMAKVTVPTPKKVALKALPKIRA